MLKQHCLCGGPELCDVILHLEDTRCELLVNLKEGFEILLPRYMGGVVAGKCGDQARVLEDGLEVDSPGLVSA